MKKLLLIIALVFTSSIALNAECTKEQKVKMIINGIDQTTIDKVCAKKQVKKVLKKRITKARRYAIKRDRVYVSSSISYYEAFIYPDVNYRGEEEISNSSALKFSLGYVFDNNDRVEVLLKRDSLGSEQGNINIYFDEFTSIGLNYIHTFGNKQVEIGSYRPFVSLGVSNYYYDDELINNQEYYGSAFPMSLGVSYSLNNYVELDLSFDYSFVSWDDMALYPDLDITQTTFSGFTAVARYKF